MATDEKEVEKQRALLSAFYKQYAPEKLAEVDSNISRYAASDSGGFEKMWRILNKKYVLKTATAPSSQLSPPPPPAAGKKTAAGVAAPVLMGGKAPSAPISRPAVAAAGGKQPPALLSAPRRGVDPSPPQMLSLPPPVAGNNTNNTTTPPAAASGGLSSNASLFNGSYILPPALADFAGQQQQQQQQLLKSSNALATTQFPTSSSFPSGGSNAAAISRPPLAPNIGAAAGDSAVVGAAAFSAAPPRMSAQQMQVIEEEAQRNRLTRFFLHHAPERVGEVERHLLNGRRNGYDWVWSELLAKYGPEPPAPGSSKAPSGGVGLSSSPPQQQGVAPLKYSAAETKLWRDRLVKFYSYYAPEKTGVDVDAALAKYAPPDGYETMWKALLAKYGAMPANQAGFAAQVAAAASNGGAPAGATSQNALIKRYLPEAGDAAAAGSPAAKEGGFPSSQPSSPPLRPTATDVANASLRRPDIVSGAPGRAATAGGDGGGIAGSPARAISPRSGYAAVDADFPGGGGATGGAGSPARSAGGTDLSPLSSAGSVGSPQQQASGAANVVPNAGGGGGTAGSLPITAAAAPTIQFAPTPMRFTSPAVVLHALLRFQGCSVVVYDHGTDEQKLNFRRSIEREVAHNLGIHVSQVRVSKLSPGIVVELDLELTQDQAMVGTAETLVSKVLLGTFTVASVRDSYKRDLGGNPMQLFPEGAALFGGGCTPQFGLDDRRAGDNGGGSAPDFTGIEPFVVDGGGPAGRQLGDQPAPVILWPPPMAPSKPPLSSAGYNRTGGDAEAQLADAKQQPQDLSPPRHPASTGDGAALRGSGSTARPTVPNNSRLLSPLRLWATSDPNAEEALGRSPPRNALTRRPAPGVGGSTASPPAATAGGALSGSDRENAREGFTRDSGASPVRGRPATSGAAAVDLDGRAERREGSPIRRVTATFDMPQRVNARDGPAHRASGQRYKSDGTGGVGIGIVGNNAGEDGAALQKGFLSRLWGESPGGPNDPSAPPVSMHRDGEPHPQRPYDSLVPSTDRSAEMFREMRKPLILNTTPSTDRGPLTTRTAPPTYTQFDPTAAEQSHSSAATQFREDPNAAAKAHAAALLATLRSPRDDMMQAGRLQAGPFAAFTALRADNVRVHPNAAYATATLDDRAGPPQVLSAVANTRATVTAPAMDRFGGSTSYYGGGGGGNQGQGVSRSERPNPLVIPPSFQASPAMPQRLGLPSWAPAALPSPLDGTAAQAPAFNNNNNGGGGGSRGVKSNVAVPSNPEYLYEIVQALSR